MMVPQEGESDIPFPPGYLIPIDEESSAECSIQDLGDTIPSGVIEHDSRTCGCKVCARSPILLASQTPDPEIAGGHQADHTPL